MAVQHRKEAFKLAPYFKQLSLVPITKYKRLTEIGVSTEYSPVII